MVKLTANDNISDIYKLYDINKMVNVVVLYQNQSAKNIIINHSSDQIDGE